MPGTCTQDWTMQWITAPLDASLQKQKENKQFIHRLVAGEDIWAWFPPTWWNTGSTPLPIMESMSNTWPKSGDLPSLCFLWQHKSQDGQGSWPCSSSSRISRSSWTRSGVKCTAWWWGQAPCCDPRRKGHLWEGWVWEAGWQWGTLPSPAGPGVRSRLGLGLELAAFGSLCNAGQLEGFTFQRGKENVKN